jgi:hypothetical protein
MFVSFPSEIELPIQLIAGFFVTLIAFVWAARAAYSRVMQAITDLKRDVVALSERNTRADMEAHALLARQQTTEVAQAVVVTQITALLKTIDRLDSNITKLVERIQ